MSAAQEYISLGYVLTTPYTFTNRRPLGVPNPFYTPSPCICDFLPDSCVLDWSSFQAEYDRLGLNAGQGKQLTIQMNQMFEAELWGFDSVFVRLDDARQFVAEWLGNIPDFKLLGVGLPEPWLARFWHHWEESKEEHLIDDAEIRGPFRCLRNAQAVADGGHILGYEVLGLSRIGDMHTSACIDVRGDFVSGFSATFTPDGFLTILEQADLAAREYMFVEDGVSIKDCFWCPVQITEYPL